MADLAVWLYGVEIGSLTGPDSRSFDFRATAAGIDAFGLGSTVLSLAVPLDAVPVRSRAARRRNYFAELLPEGAVRTRLAARAGVPESDVLTLLARYGRDVAGAVQIVDPSDRAEPRTPRVVPLAGAEVAALLEDAVGRPLGNAPISGKSSLAGVQDKVVLARVEGRWNQVLDGYPSTHILKPVSRAFPTLIYDEEFATRLAGEVGLTASDVALERFAGVDALVIARYDRSGEAPGGRLHQEDFSQVLGASGDEKYQEYGGKVSLKRIARVLEVSCGSSARMRLLKFVTFSVAIGNLDLHGKNLALLHPPDGAVGLAPAYDLVPLRHQSTDGRLALSVGGEYRHAEVTRDHLVAEAETWGVRSPAPVVDSMLEAVAESATEPTEGAHPGLADQVRRFARRLAVGEPAGD